MVVGRGRGCIVPLPHNLAPLEGWYDSESQTKCQQLYSPFLASRQEQLVWSLEGGSVSVDRDTGQHKFERLAPNPVLLTVGLAKSFLHPVERSGPKGPQNSSLTAPRPSATPTVGIALIFKNTLFTGRP